MAELAAVVELLFTAADRRPPLSGAYRWTAYPSMATQQYAFAATNDRWRVDRQDDEATSTGFDSRTAWTLDTSGLPLPISALDDLLDPSWLLQRRHLRLETEAANVANRTAIIATSTPRQRLIPAPIASRAETVVAIDAQYGFLLRRADRWEGTARSVKELANLTVPDPSAAEPSRYAAPAGAKRIDDLSVAAVPQRWRPRLIGAAALFVAGARVLAGKPVMPGVARPRDATVDDTDQ